MAKHLYKVLSNCAQDTKGEKLNPNLIDHALISDKGVTIRMKAGYSRSLGTKHIKQYFGDK